MAKIAQAASESLNGLIAVLHDGLALHEKAMNELDDKKLHEISKEMIEQRRNAIESIKPFVQQGGKEPTSRGTFVGDARAVLAKAKGLFGDPKAALVGELARMEETTVSTIDTCIEDAGDNEIATMLKEWKDSFSKAAEKLHKMRESEAA
jgi:uncharacterized protein (TIGR02284 family)